MRKIEKIYLKEKKIMFLKKFKKGMEVGAKSGLRSTQKKVMRSLEKQEKKLWKDINVTQNKSR